MIKDKELDDLEIDENGERESLPEAKSSVTYSLLSKMGFPMLFTVRSKDEAELLEVMQDLEADFLLKGFQPDNRKFQSSQPTQTRINVPATATPMSEPATERQAYLLKLKGFWKPGMTKKEASDKISEIKGNA